MNTNCDSFRRMVAGVAVGLLLVGGVLLAGCAGRRGGGGVFLPPGDPGAGRTAFGDLMCHTCHRVADPAWSFPAPTASPPVPVDLGAEAARPTRAEWARSIVDPSHEIAPGYRDDLVADGRLSRMGDYTHLLTVRQLADLVAYLDSLHTGLSAGEE